MTQPTPSDVHVNTPLTNMSVAFIQSADSFVARRVFPTISVQKQSDRYYTYDRASFMRDSMEKRAPGAESAGGGYTVDNTPNYFCDIFALHKDVPDQVRANSDAALNADRDAALYLAQQRLIKMEKVFVSNYMTTSVWTTDVTGVSGTPSGAQVKQWNDAASTPIEDVRAYKTVVQQLTGIRPNTLTIGQEVWDALADHPDIVDRVKYSGGVGNGNPARITKEAVAAVMELDNIYVSGAVNATSAEGATDTFAFIAGKAALLSYSAPAPGLQIPTAGYTFEWNGYLGSVEGQRITSFRMEHLKSERVEIEAAFDMKVVSADLGVYFASLVA